MKYIIYTHIYTYVSIISVLILKHWEMCVQCILTQGASRIASQSCSVWFCILSSPRTGWNWNSAAWVSFNNVYSAILEKDWDRIGVSSTWKTGAQIGMKDHQRYLKFVGLAWIGMGRMTSPVKTDWKLICRRSWQSPATTGPSVQTSPEVLMSRSEM